jgi:hypothetical protein
METARVTTRLAGKLHEYLRGDPPEVERHRPLLMLNSLNR